MKLVESPLSDIDRQPVIDKMLMAINSGRHWDDYAQENRKDKFPNGIANDDAYDMRKQWADFDEMSPRTPLKSKRFQDRVAEWANARYDEVITKLKTDLRTLFRNGRINIFRVMRVPNHWFEKVIDSGHTSLGVYWTYDLKQWEAEIGAYPIWADDKLEGHDILIKASVAIHDVDWSYTILSHMDWHSGDREFELRIKPGAPVHVLGIRDLETRRPYSFDFTNVSFTA